VGKDEDRRRFRANPTRNQLEGKERRQVRQGGVRKQEEEESRQVWKRRGEKQSGGEVRK
jgi:hypothetical protein